MIPLKKTENVNNKNDLAHLNLKKNLISYLKKG